jgi:hypothetical protein
VRLVCLAACFAACLAACSFSSPKAGPDADIDAPDAPEGQWMMTERITVPGTGEAVMSKTVLQAGVGYHLRASGTYFYAVGTEGDAEYFDFDPGPPADSAVNVDVGISVNDPNVDLQRMPRWGEYNPAHVYEVPWMGEGGTIVLQLHDGNYLNNGGSLTVDILTLQ